MQVVDEFAAIAAENEPAGHCEHADSPVVDAYVPAGQLTQPLAEAAPTFAPNFPRGHSAHVETDDAPDAEE